MALSVSICFYLSLDPSITSKLVLLSQWLLNRTTRGSATEWKSVPTHFLQMLFSREREKEREKEREVKNVKSFLLKELSELIFCLTFVKDAFILSAGNR